MMNPQYSSQQSSVHPNQVMPPHSASYSHAQSQSMYNGLDTNSNPGYIPPSSKHPYGQPFYNQNGPQFVGQPPLRMETNVPPTFQQKFPFRTSGPTPDQLSQQVSNMTLSSNPSIRPQSSAFPPSGRDLGSSQRSLPVSSAYQPLPPSSHPPVSQYSDPSANSYTNVSYANFPHGTASFPPVSYQNQHVEPPPLHTGAMPQNLPSSYCAPASSPSQSASHLSSTSVGDTVGFSHKPPPVPYSSLSSVAKAQSGFSPVASASAPPTSGTVLYSSASQQYPTVPSMSSLHGQQPQLSAQPQQMNPPVSYQSPYSHSGISATPATGMPPPARIGAPVSQPPAQPSQTQRRLDPDQMPSPIQVIEDDRKSRSGEFCTNTRGQVPPLVTTDFIVQDGGICSPRFMRSTIYNVPCTSDMLKQASVPFAVTISPFAELNEGEVLPPISDPGEMGPVRCNRCKAYMCPFMQFIDGGRRFQCVFCKSPTEVPPEYFAHLDHLGERTDKYQRPELCLGSYELICTKDYCKNGQFPNPPAFIFMIDISYNSMRNGMVKLLCENMKRIILNKLPRENGLDFSQMKVGFVTYSNVVHFYNVKGNLAQPQMLVVSDVSDMFMPLLDGFLVNVQEAESVIDSLMEQIPLMFADTRETETILGPVIQAGLEALKAADCAGKLLVFHTTLPIAEAPGKLKNRDDRKLLGSEKEKTILTPQTTFYNSLGQDCVAAGCCVDLFLFPNAYLDIATLGQVCRLTGGQIYKYSYFQADIDGHRFLEDLQRSVEKCVAFDAVMRLRTSTGIRPTDFYGNYFMSNTTDVELAAIDCDKAISICIKYDDKLVEEEGAFLQTAVLYTSCSGQRRLRIHNLALNTCSQMADLYRNCELDTIMNTFSKEAVRLITEQAPRAVKDSFIARSAQILACYRKNCANPSSAGQLILPECMKLLPLYINCLIKCDAIAGGPEMSTDDRSFIMLALNSMDVGASAAYLYPRLLPLHDINVDSEEFPVALRCTIEKVKDHGAYLLENGIYMFLWIGHSVNQQWIQDVFGVQAAARIDIDKTSLLELNTLMSKRIRGIIEQVRKERQRYMRLILVRQGDKMEVLFRQFLVEDRTNDGSASYVDFLCHLHKEIRSLLT